MELAKTITNRGNVDVGFHESPIHPADGEGRVGKMGLDKTLDFEEILSLAHKTFSKDGNRANIVVKAGKNAKWYLKYCPPGDIERSIGTQTWRDTSRATMWVVEWNETE